MDSPKHLTESDYILDVKLFRKLHIWLTNLDTIIGKFENPLLYEINIHVFIYCGFQKAVKIYPFWTFKD